MDFLDSVQMSAMLAVVEPDYQAWLRHVRRTYSKTFCTPLHVVDSLPFDDVLQAFFEERFEDMTEEDREQHIEYILKTPEERKEEKQRITKSDDAFLEKLSKEVAEDMSKETPKKPEEKQQVKEVFQEPEEPLINMSFGDNLDFEALASSDPLGPTLLR